MYTTKKQAARRVLCILLLCLALTLSLTACVEEETRDRIRANAETVLDMLIAGDADAAYAVLTAAGSRTEFDKFADFCMPLLAGVESYELKQVGWNVRTDDGVTNTSLTFRMICADGTEYLVEATETAGTAGLTGFFFDTPEAAVADRTPAALKIAFLVFSLAVLAFVIWMIVDCARRKIRKKALWIILILCGVMLTVRAGSSGFNVNFQIGLMAATSSIQWIAEPRNALVSFAVPVGAIIYFALRRRLTPPAVAPQTLADEWTADAASPTPTQEDENKPQ